MRAGLRLIYTLCFLLLNQQTFGQQAEEIMPLQEILAALQNQYGYRFNYDPGTVIDITCRAPIKGNSLEQVVQELATETGLRFNILTNNFVTIRPGTFRVCGYLKERGSDEPVAFAFLNTGIESTVSNEHGYFEMRMSSNEPLVIRHLSYQGQQILIDTDFEDCTVIRLDFNPKKLPEIVLNDYPINGMDKLKNGSYKIDFNEFSILPGLTEADVLRSVQAFPGIMSIDETVSSINIRGGSHDQNMILWDGIKMYQSGHFFGLISMYHPQINHSVAVRKNGTPTHRSDGVSGTIEMNTDEKVNRQFKGNVGINFTDANGFMDIPLGKKSSVQVAIRKSISGIIKSPTYSEYLDRISQNTEIDTDSGNVIKSDHMFDYWDASARWIFKPSPQDEIKLNFIYTNNELVFRENAEIDGNQVSKESSLNQLSFGAGLFYQRTWSARHKTTFHIYESDYKLRSINVNLLENHRYLQENKISETGIGLTSEYQLGDRVKWRNGYQFIETKITNIDDLDFPVFRNLAAEVVRAHGVYTEISWTSLNNRTFLSVGGRMNYLEKFDKFIPEPRLSFNYQLSKHWNIEMLGEYKNQYTSQIINFQNDFLGVEKRRWRLSDNQDIPVITSRQASLGISFDKNGWLLNNEAFYKKVNGITSQSQGFQNQFEFVRSVGDYTAHGIDLMVRKQLSHINTWLSYSYLDSQYSFEELEENDFPSNFDITHTFTLGATYNKSPLLLSGGLNWHTGKPTTRPVSDPSEGIFEYQSPNSDRLNTYFRVDVSAVYQIDTGKKTRAEIGFSIWNLLNRKNPINNFYRLDGQALPEEVIQQSLSITPNFLARFHF